jgi:hypothetical protein
MVLSCLTDIMIYNKHRMNWFIFHHCGLSKIHATSYTYRHTLMTIVLLTVRWYGYTAMNNTLYIISITVVDYKDCNDKFVFTYVTMCFPQKYINVVVFLCVAKASFFCERVLHFSVNGFYTEEYFILFFQCHSISWETSGLPTLRDTTNLHLTYQ